MNLYSLFYDGLKLRYSGSMWQWAKVSGEPNPKGNWGKQAHWGLQVLTPKHLGHQVCPTSESCVSSINSVKVMGCPSTSHQQEKNTTELLHYFYFFFLNSASQRPNCLQVPTLNAPMHCPTAPSSTTKEARSFFHIPLKLKPSLSHKETHSLRWTTPLIEKHQTTGDSSENLEKSAQRVKGNWSWQLFFLWRWMKWWESPKMKKILALCAKSMRYILKACF